MVTQALWDGSNAFAVGRTADTTQTPQMAKSNKETLFLLRKT